jgi:hypothetical protein
MDPQSRVHHFRTDLTIKQQPGGERVIYTTTLNPKFGQNPNAGKKVGDRGKIPYLLFNFQI